MCPEGSDTAGESVRGGSDRRAPYPTCVALYHSATVGIGQLGQSLEIVSVAYWDIVAYYMVYPLQ